MYKSTYDIHRVIECVYGLIRTDMKLAERGYLKTTAILPKKLILEIQKYVLGETIYIPKPKTSHQRRGIRSGTRKLIDDRNASIKR